ncbi:MAG: xanthine dehydrogenase family protein subunit M [Alphaproteobacteria bacterium]|nr:xanthine dehydrogenase family protein subunit M [Alphaproteobacteria bacterium]
MYAFTYQKPKTVAEAAAALAADGDAKVVSGGQTLIPTLKQRLAAPSALVDLGSIEGLAGITVAGDTVTIGAMTKHAAVAHSAEVQGAIPALAALAEGIGDPQVRNRGTLGGSIANHDPAADYPAGCLGLGATIVTSKRELSADDFFTGMFSTALEDDELVTAVRFPKPKRAAYAKFPNPASRYAIVGVFVADTASGIRVAVTGAGGGVFRATELEAALTAKGFAAGSLDGVTVSSDGLNSDIHASAEYRAHLITVMAKRAVAAAG